MWLLGLCVWVIVKCKIVQIWSVPVIGLLFCSMIPIAQWKMSLISTSGQAVVSSSYLFACGMSFFLAQQVKNSHGNLLIDCVFAGIGTASLLTVGMQLIQLLSLYSNDPASLLGFFILPTLNSSRPSGNLLQPNLAATLLVWGAVAGFWWQLKKPAHLFLLAIYLLLLGAGVALTQSRIGLIETLVLPVILWNWKRLLLERRILLLSLVFPLVTWGLHFAFPLIAQWSDLPIGGRTLAELAQDQVRTTAYEIFINALLVHPWSGYGLSHLGNAYLELAQTQKNQSLNFIHSHNIFLDIFLWFGIPLGGLITMACLYWLRYCIRSIKNIEHVLLLIVILIFGLHSMVELPHQYAIFLIPVFIAAGSINNLFLSSWSWASSKCITSVLAGLGFLTWGIFAHDYLQYEEYYSEWLFKRQRVGQSTNNQSPNLIILNQLDYVMQLQLLQPKPNESQENLNWMRIAVRGEPSQLAYFNYIAAMALNNNREEAVKWMHKVNATYDKKNHENLIRVWSSLQKKYPNISDLNWEIHR
jgi:Virulence factor membrane-bound polymerase, C-terminal/O-Antigen ligase